MGRPKATSSSPDEIRCPTCHAVQWRRLGERIVVLAAHDEGRPRLQHLLVNEHGAWDWTCERCGHGVKGGSSLDHRLGRVQAPAPLAGIAIAGTGGLGGVVGALRERLQSLGSTTGVAVTTVAIGAVVAVLLVASAPLPGGTPPVAPATASQVATSTAPPTADPSAPEPIRDFGLLANATDGALAGRTVELDRVPVQSVTGDVTFWIGPSERDRIFVVLDERTQGESAVTIRADQLVHVRGTVARTPVSRGDLTAQDRSALEGEAVYLQIVWAEVVADPS